MERPLFCSAARRHRRADYESTSTSVLVGYGEFADEEYGREEEGEEREEEERRTVAFAEGEHSVTPPTIAPPSAAMPRIADKARAQVGVESSPASW
jgi:hypothetical protein